MSALGQKRTSDDVRAMSALLPRADIRRRDLESALAISGHLTPRYRIDLTLSSVSAQNCDGGSPRGSKGNRVRGLEDDAHNAVAAPATVSGECSVCIATGSDVLGRRPKTATREPGDLPPATVTRERVGRGALTNSVRWLCDPHEGEGGPQSAKIAVTGP